MDTSNLNYYFKLVNYLKEQYICNPFLKGLFNVEEKALDLLKNNNYDIEICVRKILFPSTFIAESDNSANHLFNKSASVMLGNTNLLSSSNNNINLHKIKTNNISNDKINKKSQDMKLYVNSALHDLIGSNFHEKEEWLNLIRIKLKESINYSELQKLIEIGEKLKIEVPDFLLKEIENSYKESVKIKHILNKKTSLKELNAMYNSVINMSIKTDEYYQLKDMLNKCKNWLERTNLFLNTKINYKTMQNLYNEGKNLPVKFNEFEDLKSKYIKAQNWQERYSAIPKHSKTRQSVIVKSSERTSLSILKNLIEESNIINFTSSDVITLKNNYTLLNSYENKIRMTLEDFDVYSYTINQNQLKVPVRSKETLLEYMGKIDVLKFNTSLYDELLHNIEYQEWKEKKDALISIKDKPIKLNQLKNLISEAYKKNLNSKDFLITCELKKFEDNVDMIDKWIKNMYNIFYKEYKNNDKEDNIEKKANDDNNNDYYYTFDEFHELVRIADDFSFKTEEVYYIYDKVQEVEEFVAECSLVLSDKTYNQDKLKELKDKILKYKIKCNEFNKITNYINKVNNLNTNFIKVIDDSNNLKDIKLSTYFASNIIETCNIEMKFHNIYFNKDLLYSVLDNIGDNSSQEEITIKNKLIYFYSFSEDNLQELNKNIIIDFTFFEKLLQFIEVTENKRSSNNLSVVKHLLASYPSTDKFTCYKSILSDFINKSEEFIKLYSVKNIVYEYYQNSNKNVNSFNRLCNDVPCVFFINSYIKSLHFCVNNDEYIDEISNVIVYKSSVELLANIDTSKVKKMNLDQAERLKSILINYKLEFTNDFIKLDSQINSTINWINEYTMLCNTANSHNKIEIDKLIKLFNDGVNQPIVCKELESLTTYFSAINTLLFESRNFCKNIDYFNKYKSNNVSKICKKVNYADLENLYNTLSQVQIRVPEFDILINLYIVSYEWREEAYNILSSREFCSLYYLNINNLKNNLENCLNFDNNYINDNKSNTSKCLANINILELKEIRSNNNINKYIKYNKECKNKDTNNYKNRDATSQNSKNNSFYTNNNLDNSSINASTLKQKRIRQINEKSNSQDKIFNSSKYQMDDNNESITSLTNHKHNKKINKVSKNKKLQYRDTSLNHTVNNINSLNTNKRKKQRYNNKINNDIINESNNANANYINNLNLNASLNNISTTAILQNLINTKSFIKDQEFNLYFVNCLDNIDMKHFYSLTYIERLNIIQENIQLKKDSNEQFCICRRGDDSVNFMIGCEQCKEWFHGACIRMPRFVAQKGLQFYCSFCVKRHNIRCVSLNSIDLNSFNNKIKRIQDTTTTTTNNTTITNNLEIDNQNFDLKGFTTVNITCEYLFNSKRISIENIKEIISEGDFLPVELEELVELNNWIFKCNTWNNDLDNYVKNILDYLKPFLTNKRVKSFSLHEEDQKDIISMYLESEGYPIDMPNSIFCILILKHYDWFNEAAKFFESNILVDLDEMYYNIENNSHSIDSNKKKVNNKYDDINNMNSINNEQTKNKLFASYYVLFNFDFKDLTLTEIKKTYLSKISIKANELYNEYKNRYLLLEYIENLVKDKKIKDNNTLINRKEIELIIKQFDQNVNFTIDDIKNYYNFKSKVKSELVYLKNNPSVYNTNTDNLNCSYINKQYLLNYNNNDNNVLKKETNLDENGPCIIVEKTGNFIEESLFKTMPYINSNPSLDKSICFSNEIELNNSDNKTNNSNYAEEYRLIEEDYTPIINSSSLITNKENSNLKTTTNINNTNNLIPENDFKQNIKGKINKNIFNLFILFRYNFK